MSRPLVLIAGLAIVAAALYMFWPKTATPPVMQQTSPSQPDTASLNEAVVPTQTESAAEEALADAQPTTEQPSRLPPFDARGNQPDWSLSIDGDHITLRTSAAVMDFYRVTHSANPVGINYEAQKGDTQLKVSLASVPCQDTVTLMPHPFAVSVQLNDKTYSGCGGDPLTLILGEWRVTNLATQAIAPETEMRLNFLPTGQLSAHTGCNRLNGSYVLAQDRLQITPGAMTRIACTEEVRNQLEQQLLDFLPTVQRFTRQPDGSLELITSSDDRLIAVTAKKAVETPASTPDEIGGAQ